MGESKINVSMIIIYPFKCENDYLKITLKLSASLIIVAL